MREHLQAGLISGLAIFILGLIGQRTGCVMLIAPFGASCVLLFGFPDSQFVKLRNLFGGHLIASTVGLMFLHFSSGSLVMMALAVGTAIFLMLATQTAHPAAGANPLLIMVSHAGWPFLVFPVLSGIAVLAVVASVYRKVLASGG